MLKRKPSWSPTAEQRRAEAINSNTLRCRVKQRSDLMGEPASIVLAVALSFCNGLDGRKPFCPSAHGDLRRGDVAGGIRVSNSSDRDCCRAGRQLETRRGIG